jgi:hypothetical protein
LEGKPTKPLNASSVIWLTGTPAEVNCFIEEAQAKHRAILIGHSENVRSQLVRITKWENLEGLQQFIVKNGKAPTEAAFMLLQGQIIGLLVDPNTNTTH